VAISPRGPNDRATQFVQLLAANEQRLGCYVLSLVANWSDAEEILQETKLRLWEQFDTYDSGKDFGSWACTVARYQVLTLRTRAARSRVSFSRAFIDRVEAEVAKVAPESDERLRLLQQCIEKLSEWQRDLLRRSCLAGDSVKKVAAQLGRKVDSTRKALFRIRRELCRCIEAATRREQWP
jgi:RNA polymerase sigma-70 factor, ECF subfamily